MLTEYKTELIVDKERICSYIHGAFIFQFLFPREALKERRFDERFSLGEDVLFLSEILSRTDTVGDCDRVIYYRVLREGSAVHTDMGPDYYNDICPIQYH